MSFLQFMFSAIAKLPLIGPDDDYEADLLLYGSKPIGLFVDKRPPSGVIEDYSPLMERIRSDIAILDKAVQIGKLTKHDYETIDQNGMQCSWNYYCQIGNEQDMMILAAQIQSDSTGNEPKQPLPKEYGEYFGYLPSDIHLFNRGGYKSLPFFLGGCPRMRYFGNDLFF